MPLFDLKDKSRYATFSRRAFLLTGGMTGVFAALAARLYQLQIVDGRDFLTAADANRVNQRLVAPARGRILDRFGIELANDRRNYRVLIIPEQVSSVRQSLDALAHVVNVTDQQREKALHLIAQNKPFMPVAVLENLSWEDFARINLHLPYLPGVLPDIGETRDYPFAGELSHVVGYVAAVGPDDMHDDNDMLLDLPGFRIGKRGIEKKFDRDIRGQAGIAREEVNAYGRVIRELSRQPGVPGKDVYLTIDRQLQKFVSDRLGTESVACAVMDVDNGDVLALASTPSFDPNLFNVGINSAQWRALTSDDHTPLMNKVLSGVYPPGSTFKPAVALAAVEAGVAVPGYSVFCSGGLTLGNHEFHCWKRGGHGQVDLHKAIQQSCDVFFYETARRIGIDAIAASARKLGLGAPTGIEIPGERAGTIPDAEWKEATYGVPWQQGETLVAGIGQGYVLVTPIQLCTQAARIASGRNVSPRMVYAVGEERQPRVALEPLGFSDDALAAVRLGMSAVANEAGGTAYAWRIQDAGFEMAGKTGTAQVRVITKEERLHGVQKNENLPWNLRDHALFIAFAPIDKPRYACAIVMEHGAVADHPHVQMVRDILLFTQKRDPRRLPTAYPVTSA
ncbi:MAG TPA: penicillin-binding protein 2 [Rhizomicrobium sp.]|nr:penicillin-binding protein 2 [Rhizomicrobium sp.]